MPGVQPIEARISGWPPLSGSFDDPLAGGRASFPASWDRPGFEVYVFETVALHFRGRPVVCFLERRRTRQARPDHVAEVSQVGHDLGILLGRINQFLIDCRDFYNFGIGDFWIGGDLRPAERLAAEQNQQRRDNGELRTRTICSNLRVRSTHEMRSRLLQEMDAFGIDGIQRNLLTSTHVSVLHQTTSALRPSGASVRFGIFRRRRRLRPRSPSGARISRDRPAHRGNRSAADW